MDSKYIEEAKKINKTYLSKDEDGDIYCSDNDSFHIEWDGLVCKILEENGYRKVARMYREASQDFWYS